MLAAGLCSAQVSGDDFDDYDNVEEQEPNLDSHHPHHHRQQQQQMQHLQQLHPPDKPQPQKTIDVVVLDCSPEVLPRSKQDAGFAKLAASASAGDDEDLTQPSPDNLALRRAAKEREEKKTAAGEGVDVVVGKRQPEVGAQPNNGTALFKAAPTGAAKAADTNSQGGRASGKSCASAQRRPQASGSGSATWRAASRNPNVWHMLTKQGAFSAKAATLPGQAKAGAHDGAPTVDMLAQPVAAAAGAPADKQLISDMGAESDRVLAVSAPKAGHIVNGRYSGGTDTAALRDVDTVSPQPGRRVQQQAAFKYQGLCRNNRLRVNIAVCDGASADSVILSKKNACNAPTLQSGLSFLTCMQTWFASVTSVQPCLALHARSAKTFMMPWSLGASLLLERCPLVGINSLCKTLLVQAQVHTLLSARYHRHMQPERSNCSYQLA